MVSNTTVLVIIILALVLLGISLFVSLSAPSFRQIEQGTSESNSQGNINLVIASPGK